jgi:hypothetical protein
MADLKVQGPPPDPTAYELPDAAAIAEAIKRYQNQRVSVDTAGFDAAQPAQLQALRAAMGMVDGTAPSQAAAMQSRDQDIVSRQGVNTHDLAHALLTHAGGLTQVANQQSGARAKETQAGGQMVNSAIPAMHAQALASGQLHAAAGHANNHFVNQGIGLQTALEAAIAGGKNAYTNTDTSYRTGVSRAALSADQTSFNNTMAALRGVSGAVSAAIPAGVAAFGDNSFKYDSGLTANEANAAAGDTRAGYDPSAVFKQNGSNPTVGNPYYSGPTNSYTGAGTFAPGAGQFDNSVGASKLEKFTP